MDPYLEDEKRWPAFQPVVVQALYQMLLPGLMDRYRARVGERIYCSEQALFTSIIREEHKEAFIEVRQRSDGRLITLVEVVSPANKLSAEGRKLYLERRDEVKKMNANVVEIDLVLQGQTLIDYAKDAAPTWDYAVVVTRWTHPDRYEIYSATLPKRLPRFRVPLASDDRDTVLDLQSAVSRAYDQGDFAKHIDYTRDPATRLSDENRKWLDERLKEEKLRN
jgi:Holliday junction resolvase-like predicted endonuclease